MTTTLQKDPSAPTEDPLDAAQLPRLVSWYVLMALLAKAVGQAARYHDWIN